MPGKAILVLETPWWPPEQNKKRASVLPFFQGLANYVEHFSVYHSNFYEKQGFVTALKDDLIKTRESRLYIYIAAHGGSCTVGGTGTSSGVNLSTVFSEIAKVTRYKNIEGVIIGSCNVGGKVNHFKEVLIGTRIPWIFGYTCEIDWTKSTLIDLSIFEILTMLSSDDLKKRPRIINAFKRSLERFNGDVVIGKKGVKDVALKDAITLVTKPRGKGNVPQDNTDELRESLAWWWE
jgi:hypothetical protein